MTQRLLNIIGPPSATLAQHLHIIGSTAVYVYLAYLISGPASRLNQRGGLQVDRPVIGGAGGMPPGNFDKKQGISGIFRGGGGVTDTQKEPWIRP